MFGIIGWLCLDKSSLQYNRVVIYRYRQNRTSLIPSLQYKSTVCMTKCYLLYKLYMLYELYEYCNTLDVSFIQYNVRVLSFVHCIHIISYIYTKSTSYTSFIQSVILYVSSLRYITMLYLLWSIVLLAYHQLQYSMIYVSALQYFTLVVSDLQFIALDVSIMITIIITKLILPPISSKRIELSGVSSTRGHLVQGVGQTHSPGTMLISSTNDQME